ncbi:MAG: recombinase family protein [Actinobacteria bacterium]|nr:recombinase family protein [Actinomycetota bacterium]
MTEEIISYCLYARKSSESDERQAMSIESQIKEMLLLAEKENILVKDIRSEACSAKVSGTRPVFGKIIEDIKAGLFNGLLTWAPDRLSRNAGDLGTLIDLMDAKKLLSIRTYSQVFSDSPNEKFLLMILCSQAKLENDNRGLNVKRGIRAKCEMGWRPCMPPLGYYNRAFGGIKDIVIDPDRGFLVSEMFNRVANHKYSGREVKIWLDKSGFTTRTGKRATLSQIYLMLKNPFYYGQFEYPLESGKWYSGSHEPLITKELFDKVQKQLEVPRKAKWGSKGFAFKHVIKCASCKSSIVGEEKFKRLLDGSVKKHIYYHCSGSKECSYIKPYIREEKLIEQLTGFIDGLDEKSICLSGSLKLGYYEYKKITDSIIQSSNINCSKPFNIRSYAKYILSEGTSQEKSELIGGLGIPLYFYNGTICTEPIS